MVERKGNGRGRKKGRQRTEEMIGSNYVDKNGHRRNNNLTAQTEGKMEEATTGRNLKDE